MSAETMTSSPSENSQDSENPKPTKDLDDIPEGGLNDLMKVFKPILEKYTRLRLYRLFSFIPFRLRYAVWMWVGAVVWKLPQTRKIIQNGIESLQSIFPEKSYKEIRVISKNSWRVLAFGFFSLLLVDLPNLTTKNVDKFIEFRGLNHVEDALKRGKGIIVASTHVGPLPAMYISMALKGYKTNLIANVRVSGPLVAIRPIPNVRCIPTGSLKGKNSIRDKLHYVLRQNELLFIFADFSQRKQMGIKFLGKLGHTPAGIPTMAKETGAAIIPAMVYPKDMKHFVVHFLPEYKLIERPDMTKKEFLGENMLALNNMMTWLIRKAPILYFEHTSYEMLKTYRRETKVDDGNSKEVAHELFNLARQVVYTTYEKGRDDQKYYDIIDTIEGELKTIPESQLSDRRFTAEFVIKSSRVRDSLLQITREAIDMGLDHAVVKVLHKAMQQLVVLPKAG